MTTASSSRVAAARERIAKLDHLRAFISLSDEQGDGPVLAVKDLIDVAGMVTTGGSIDHDAEPATVDAPVVARLRAAGWVVVGKTNLHEWGLGPTSGNPHYGAVLNPRDPTRIAGGSSGGSAVAVATGMCDLALGTDTGGSIRIPSALCGTTGIRPTLGSVDTRGVATLAQSFDTVGPMARDVAAVADALALMGGLPGEPAAPRDLHDLRLATPRGWVDGLDDDVAACWSRVRPLLDEIELPALERFVEPGLTILYAEAAANHERQLTERPETLGDDVRELMGRGAETSAPRYLGALRERLALRAIVDEALDGWDALVLPTTAIVAPPVNADPIAVRDALTCFTRPFGVTGHPAVSLPGPAEGLPVGIQLAGPRGGDGQLLAVAEALEQAWKEQR